MKHLITGIAVPLLLLINAFLIPEPYSHPLINLAIAPSKLIPFFEDRELIRELTEFVFGHLTPNFAPIQIIILIIFWFFLSLGASALISYLRKRYKNS